MGGTLVSIGSRVISGLGRCRPGRGGAAPGRCDRARTPCRRRGRTPRRRPTDAPGPHRRCLLGLSCSFTYRVPAPPAGTAITSALPARGCRHALYSAAVEDPETVGAHREPDPAILAGQPGPSCEHVGSEAPLGGDVGVADTVSGHRPAPGHLAHACHQRPAAAAACSWSWSSSGAGRAWVRVGNGSSRSPQPPGPAASSGPVSRQASRAAVMASRSIACPMSTISWRRSPNGSSHVSSMSRR